MKYSVQNEIILKILKENVVHPTAEYLYDKIKEQYPTLGKATVYRNLSKMVEQNIIKKIDGLEISAHYDHNTFEHYHFICTKCGKIFDISSDIAPDLTKKIENVTGNSVEKCDFVVRGICKNCKN